MRLPPLNGGGSCFHSSSRTSSSRTSSSRTLVLETLFRDEKRRRGEEEKTKLIPSRFPDQANQKDVQRAQPFVGSNFVEPRFVLPDDSLGIDHHP